MTKIAIMQPTYLPWIGYFGLMEAVDIFVLLDSVQFARRSWQQRNQIKTVNGLQWLTVPVISKGLRNQRICETLVQPDAGFPEKHIRGIQAAYGRCPYFKAYADGLFSVLAGGHTHLSGLTISLIDWFKANLGIRTETLQASQLAASGRKAGLLAAICQELGATSYVSAPGSRDYLDIANDFDQIGIPVTYFDFIHPVYAQTHGAFIPYASTIDLMFNCGEDSMNIIRSGIRPAV